MQCLVEELYLYKKNNSYGFSTYRSILLSQCNSINHGVDSPSLVNDRFIILALMTIALALNMSRM